MERPGTRYRALATRCRQSAANALDSLDRAALLQIATAYDRRAAEIEEDWKSRKVAGLDATEARHSCENPNPNLGLGEDRDPDLHYERSTSEMFSKIAVR
jgi:hypothetical protein